MPKVTKAEKAEVDARKAEFDKRYKALVDELKCDFGQTPVTVQLAPGVWGMAIRNEIVDMKTVGIPSPVQM